MSETVSKPRLNAVGQPIGEAILDWKPVPRPPRTPIDGRYCRIEPIDPARHAKALFEAVSDDQDGAGWTYLGAGPFSTSSAYEAWMAATCLRDDPLFHAIVDNVSGAPVGVAAYLRIEPAVGVIEIGHIHYSPRLQRTRAATEAMYLFMRRVFEELGYRRYEWKCDSLNEPSRRAAARLGFAYEGTFRQATVYKGRNRDTAWFSILDREWPGLKTAYEAWLDPSNFDADGRQRRALHELTAEALRPLR
ncbi:GNAT family N-acetyltransferase [Pendulispora albinea]|uniref:GNAT family N-acetyltransferase n=1 Tax=Pendulispora albinea TaxID=2741071 RepID=A0ABZ2MC29_9BACT